MSIVPLDPESERRLRKLQEEQRVKVTEALRASGRRRRRVVLLEVVVEGGRVSSDSKLRTEDYPISEEHP